MARISIRPDTDASNSGWSDQAGGTTNLYTAVDEDTFEDADYIRSSENPAADIIRFRLSNFAGAVTEPFNVKYRYGTTGSGECTITARLKQGSTVIKEWIHINATTTFQTVAQTLSTGEFASITDFSDLFIEFEAGPVAAAPSWVLIASVAARSSDGSGLGTGSNPINTTGADLLVMVTSQYSGSPTPTIVDSKGNTWTSLTSGVNSGLQTRIRYCKPTSVGIGHAWSADGSSTYGSMVVAAFSGCSNSSPFDVENGGTGTSSTASAGSGITPTQSGELIIAAAGLSDGTASSIDAGFNIIDTNSFTPGVAYGSSLAHNTSSAAVDPNWTLSVSADWVATIASFKAT